MQSCNIVASVTVWYRLPKPTLYRYDHPAGDKEISGRGGVEGGRDDDVVDADVDDPDDENYQLLRLSLLTSCRGYSLGSILEIIC